MLYGGLSAAANRSDGDIRCAARVCGTAADSRNCAVFCRGAACHNRAGAVSADSFVADFQSDDRNDIRINWLICRTVFPVLSDCRAEMHSVGILWCAACGSDGLERTDPRHSLLLYFV